MLSRLFCFVLVLFFVIPLLQETHHAISLNSSFSSFSSVYAKSESTQKRSYKKRNKRNKRYKSYTRKSSEKAQDSSIRPNSSLRCKITHLSDGDSFQAQCDGAKSDQFRMLYIDAPEMRQKPWGSRAKKALRELIDGDFVTLHVSRRDIYQRWLVRMERNGKDINEAMLEQGQAVIYGRAPYSYQSAEQRARYAGKGIWSKEGLHQNPSAFRKANRE